MLMLINIEEELKILENSVRDIIAFVLSQKYGSNWIYRLKISNNRVEEWRKRESTELKRLKGKVLDSRLLYYSDFYDLRSIIVKHWQDGFHDVFDDQKTIEVFLGEAEKLRDPNAHRRELFDYQKHLIKGISGELKTRIMKYRGKKENARDYFPVIEAVVDSAGNRWPNDNSDEIGLKSRQVMRVGDSVEIIVYSTDPLGDTLEYSIHKEIFSSQPEWSNSNKKSINFEESDIGTGCMISVMVKSQRSYHASSGYDHRIFMIYTVLPLH